MMDNPRNYSNELRFFFSNKFFISCILFTVILTFGFATFNITVGMDDLEGELYVGSGNAMLAAGRFTITLLSRVFGYGSKVLQNAFLIDILAIAGLIWSAVNFCVLFRRICGDAFTSEAATVFSCIFLSYPLIHEIWEYTGANLCVSIGFLFDSITLLSVYDILHQKKQHSWKHILIATISMMFVCAGYESLVPVYIFAVFALLALQVIYGPEKEKKLKEILCQGLCYAGVLAAGLVLRFLVHRFILWTTDIDQASNGATMIYWSFVPVISVLKHLFLAWIQDYILKGLIYLPITELVLACIILLVIGLAECRKHGPVILLPGLGMYLSLIILSLLQGTASPYRTCQVFTMFVAFTLMYIVMTSKHWKQTWLRNGLLIFCAFLCFYQGNCNSYFMTLNHQRSEEEAYILRDIGTDLAQKNTTEKPVIFVGSHALSNDVIESASISPDSKRWKLCDRLYNALSERLTDPYSLYFMHDPLSRKLPQTNVNSVINYGKHAGSQTAMVHLMAYYGFEYARADVDQLQSEADMYVIEHNVPAYPKDGYIQDAGDYLIVHIE